MHRKTSTRTHGGCCAAPSRSLCGARRSSPCVHDQRLSAAGRSCLAHHCGVYEGCTSSLCAGLVSRRGEATSTASWPQLGKLQRPLQLHSSLSHWLGPLLHWHCRSASSSAQFCAPAHPLVALLQPALLPDPFAKQRRAVFPKG